MRPNQHARPDPQSGWRKPLPARPATSGINWPSPAGSANSLQKPKRRPRSAPARSSWRCQRRTGCTTHSPSPGRRLSWPAFAPRRAARACCRSAARTGSRRTGCTGCWSRRRGCAASPSKAPKILSERLRERVEIRAQAALDDRRAMACPLDLHALVPMPEALLRLGPGDTRVIAWLWTHWGTTWPLRHVTEEGLSGPEILALPSGHAGIRTRFWSADWTPWRALACIRTGWPDITLRLAIDYGGT